MFVLNKINRKKKNSDEGSNSRQVEGLVLSRWNDFLQDVEEKAVGITFNDILFFASGVREVPPGGIELHVGFLHAPEQHGGKSRFPKQMHVHVS